MVDKNRLLAFVAGAGLTQTSLAEKIGMNKDTLNLKINNRSDFKTGEIERICSALQITKAADKVDIFLCKSSQ